MSHDVRWMPRARRQAVAVEQWWVTNRAAAPATFRDELARVIALVQENPELGLRVRGREIRRLLLPASEQFVYYRVRPRAKRVEVIALWGATRGVGPRLAR